MSFFLIGCSDSNDLIAPTLSDENTQHEIDLGQSVTLNPNIENNEIGSIEWFKNNQLVSTESSYTYEGENAGIDTLTLNVENGAGKQSLTYVVQVFGEYSEGVYIVGMSSEAGNGTVGFLNEEGFLPNVFQINNTGKALGDNLFGGRFNNGQISFVSQEAPFVSVVDAQTMNLNEEVITSGASAPGYIGLVGSKQYIVNADRGERTLHPLTAGAIGEAIVGVEDIPGIKSSVIPAGDKLLVAAGKSLVAVNSADNKVDTIASYDETISGIVADDKGNIWFGTSGRNETAKLRRLDDKLKVVETVELDEGIKLYRNGVLTSSGSKYFYWMEPSTGNIHRFNCETKKQELFVSPMMYGLFFTTAIKEHPVTGDVYIAGAADFMNMDKSKLIVLNSKAEKLKELDSVGESVLDFIFSYKDLYRLK